MTPKLKQKVFLVLFDDQTLADQVGLICETATEAAVIVRACNNFDDLLAAARAALHTLGPQSDMGICKQLRGVIAAIDKESGT